MYFMLPFLLASTIVGWWSDEASPSTGLFLFQFGLGPKREDQKYIYFSHQYLICEISGEKHFSRER